MLFKPSQKNKAIEFLDRHFNNKRSVYINPVKQLKSISQNAYLWLIFTHIGYQTGIDKNHIYYYYLNKFPTFQEIQTIHNQIDLVQISLSHFTKEQTIVFINNIVVDGRQEGFDIPDPEDLKCRQMYEFYRGEGLL